MLTGLVQAAVDTVEDYCNRALITQTWELVLHESALCGHDILIPRPLLQSVTSVKYIDTNGDQQTASSSLYQVDTKAEPGRIKLQPGAQWPAVGSGYTNPVEIIFVAGYGAAGSAVPIRIRQAIIALAVHWYNTEAINTIPDGVKRALDNYRLTYEL